MTFPLHSDDGDGIAGEDADDLDTPAARVRHAADEALQRTAMTPEELEAYDARCRTNRSAEVMAGAQRPLLKTRQAPMLHHVLHRDDPVVSLPALPHRNALPPPTREDAPARPPSRTPLSPVFMEVLGRVTSKLQRWHDSAEQRTTSAEARLASIEARLAALEAKGTPRDDQ